MAASNDSRTARPARTHERTTPDDLALASFKSLEQTLAALRDRKDVAAHARVDIVRESLDCVADLLWHIFSECRPSAPRVETAAAVEPAAAATDAAELLTIDAAALRNATISLASANAILTIVGERNPAE